MGRSLWSELEFARGIGRLAGKYWGSDEATLHFERLPGPVAAALRCS